MFRQWARQLSQRWRRDTTVPGGASDGVATSVGECRDRCRVALQGSLSTVTIAPQGSNRWLEAELNDGSGVVVLVWMGRRVIRGIEAGRTVRARGMICQVDDRWVMHNPWYELLS